MIEVKNISKTFKLYKTPADRLKEIILRKKYHTEYIAVDNVSFKINEGETLGIVGQNGAGKSTILKLLTGIYIPDTGSIKIDGKITGLLELGTGFNAEMTGIENIYMNGMLLGMSREEIDRKKDEIIDFAELGDFINEPIKTYSSGMVMRLAFSIAINADPKCFVVDEALAVGDAYFQQKCMRKIADFKNKGGTIIFVSHDTNAVKVLCDKCILIDYGKMIDYGEPGPIIDFYHSMMLKKMHSGDIEVKVNKIKNDLNDKSKKNTTNITTDEIELKSFRILNEEEKEISYIESEKKIIIEFEVFSKKDLSDPHYGIMIRNRLGQSVFETNTFCMKIKTDLHKKNSTKIIRFVLDVNLIADNYSISVGVANIGFNRGEFEEFLFLANDIEILKIIENDMSIKYSGITNLKTEVFIGDK